VGPGHCPCATQQQLRVPKFPSRPVDRQHILAQAVSRMTPPHAPFPDSLCLNAHADAPLSRSAIDKDAALKWAFGVAAPKNWRPLRALPREVDPLNWQDPRVGWGVVLPVGAPIPLPIQRLVEHRSFAGSPAPVLRYDARPKFQGYLQRDNENLLISLQRRGTGPQRIPTYLLIYGTPEDIPWRVQYHLNAIGPVGRLTLTGDALENYVNALVNDWAGCTARSDTAVIWSVEHTPSDVMTHLMRTSIADPLFARIACDTQLMQRSVLLKSGDPNPPTAAALTETLERLNPALVVTTSHGRTGPLTDAPRMIADLGMPVDTNHDLLTDSQLLRKWRPSGAIWYAHACCSAGCDSESLFNGIAAPGTPIAAMLSGLESIGPRVAPLPEALLGAKQPARAFIGHVEPTFDWMLQHPDTGLLITDPIINALHNRLFKPSPVGHALRETYERLGAIYLELDFHGRRYNADQNEPDAAQMLYLAMLARDIQSQVLLGDPTALLRALPPEGARTAAAPKN
jgi:hypothetical protein